MNFEEMNPAQRAQEALRWCIERGHRTGQLCCVCAAEATDKTIDGGVKLAAGINAQAIKLEHAGVAWKKRAEVAELQVAVLRGVIREMVETVESGRLCSIGSIDNTYEPQIGRGTVARWRQYIKKQQNESAWSGPSKPLCEL